MSRLLGNCMLLGDDDEAMSAAVQEWILARRSVSWWSIVSGRHLTRAVVVLTTSLS